MKKNYEYKSPSEINAIISKTIQHTDILVMWIWLKHKGIGLNLDNSGQFKIPTREDLKNIIANLITRYYSEEYWQSNVMYSKSDSEKYFFGGLAIHETETGLEVDFLFRESILPADGTKSSAIYFSKDIINMAVQN